MSPFILVTVLIQNHHFNSCKNPDEIPISQMSKWRFRDIKRVKPGSVYLSKQVHEAASHTQDDKGLGLVDAQGKLSTTVFHGW